jgi:hypothetical protein
MTTLKQFRDLPNPTVIFERLFRAALESLLPDLATAPWYVREREVVNLFMFGHLVPQFQLQTENLDIGQIGIEVPVKVFPQNDDERPSVYADIAVWPHSKAGVWRTCKPFARIEWKNISCREKSGSDLERQHQDDIDHLRHNCRLAFLNYAVLTSRRGGKVELRCTRIVDGTPTEMPKLGPCDGSRIEVENVIKNMNYKEAMSRQQEHCGSADAVLSREHADQ